jgi:hypothetical protein
MGLTLLTITGVGLRMCFDTFVAANSSPNRSTNTYSKQFATDADKISFLKRYLVLPSAVEAAEFHVVFYDNSGGSVPGPSDWDIEAVFKVAPEHLSAWTQNLQVTSQKQDLAWGYRLAQQRGWKLNATPKVYTAAGKIVAVFEREGFICKRLTSS